MRESTDLLIENRWWSERETNTEMLHIWKWFWEKKRNLVECVKTNDYVWDLRRTRRDRAKKKHTTMKKYGANLADCIDREEYCMHENKSFSSLSLSLGVHMCVRFEIQIILTENFLITHYTTSNLIWVICKTTHASTKRARARERANKKERKCQITSIFRPKTI